MPLIGAALQKAQRVDLFFTYVTVAIAISLVVYIFALKNKKSTHLDHEQGHPWTPAKAPGVPGVPGDGRRDEDEDPVAASPPSSIQRAAVPFSGRGRSATRKAVDRSADGRQAMRCTSAAMPSAIPVISMVSSIRVNRKNCQGRVSP